MSRGSPVLTLGRPVSALSRMAEHPVSWIRRSTDLDIGANGDGDSGAWDMGANATGHMQVFVSSLETDMMLSC